MAIQLDVIGLDTSAWVAFQLAGHPEHRLMRQRFAEIIRSGARLAICPVVIDEFIHVITDPRRCAIPLNMPRAIQCVQDWIDAREVICLTPSPESIRLQLEWLNGLRLGRKRIHDSSIAATYVSHGISRILTLDTEHFSIYPQISAMPADGN